MALTIAEGLRKYFRSCPYVDKKGKINFNYLGAKAAEYAIIETPNTPVTKRYLDGRTEKQKTFIFATRTAYSANVANNITNSGFFEGLEAWIEKQSRMRKFPEMPDGLQVKSMEITSSGYVMHAEADTAQLQAQLRLTYYDKRSMR